MENDNVISFEDFRKKRAKDLYEEDAFSQVFKRDLRDQEELIGWYQFHKNFSKYKLFVHSLFENNHQQGMVNPSIGFLVAFSEKQILNHVSGIVDAVKWEEREYILLQAAGKSLIQLSKELTSFSVRSTFDAQRVFEDFLLTTNKVLILQELSKSRVSGKKEDCARSLIKILDDAHFKNIDPSSDLIFIDHGNFLSRSWDSIEPYLDILI